MPLVPRSRARLQATITSAGGMLLRWRAPNVFTTAVAVLTAALAALAWLLPGYYAPVQCGVDRLTHALVSAMRRDPIPENFVLSRGISWDANPRSTPLINQRR